MKGFDVSSMTPLKMKDFLTGILQRGVRKKDEKRDTSLLGSDLVVMGLIGLSYTCFIFCRVYLSVTAPAMQFVDQDLDYDTQKHANVIDYMRNLFWVWKVDEWSYY